MNQLLCLHPFATSAIVWRTVRLELERDFEILTPTMLGHHGGAAVPARLSVASIADDVERHLDAAGWRAPHIAGNSLGGWVALELARRGRAATVTAIAPAGGWHRFTWAELRVGLWFMSRLPLARLGRWVPERLVRRQLVRRVLMADLFHRGERVSPDDAVALATAIAGCAIYPSLLWSGLRDGAISGLDEIRCPVHLIFCQHDKVVPHPRYGRRFLDEIGHATHEILANVGHIPMLEAPAEVAAAIRRHIGEHRG